VHIRKFFVLLILFLLVVVNVKMFAAVSKASDYFNAGEKAFQSENFATAVKHYEKAVKFSPQDLKTRFRYGQSLFSLKKYTESYNQFQTVLQNSPNNIIARIFLAENLIKLNRGSEARQHLDWILKVQPGHDGAIKLLSILKSEKSRLKQQVMADKEEVPLNIKPLPVKELNISSAELEHNELADANNVKDREVSAMKLSETTFKYEKIESFKDFLSQKSDSFLFNLEAARYWIEKDNLKIALEHINRAEQYATVKEVERQKLLESQVLKALILVYSQKFEAFANHLSQFKPMLSEASFNSFLDIYKQSTVLERKIDRVRLSSGIAMGSGHYAVASRLLKKAVAEEHDNLLLYGLLADAQMRCMNYNEAEKTLNHMAQINDKNSESYYNLARFYLTAVYNPKMAAKCAHYALSLSPEDSRPAVVLALLDYAAGNIRKGINRLNELVSSLEDSDMKAICEKIVKDGEHAHSLRNTDEKINFIKLMALPGATHSPAGNLVIHGKDLLNRGSTFSALECFYNAADYAEAGRSYLSFANILKRHREEEFASTVTQIGLKVLKKQLVENPESGRTQLYLALYYMQADDFKAATKAVRKGLEGHADKSTRTRLTALLDNLTRKSRKISKR
jgi:tetratricopeptide (TPR) repeat protein